MGVMAEMAAGLLLYHGAGLLRATTAVLATEAAAAGAGLIFATRVPRKDVPRQLRRHLHLTLVSLGLAGIVTSMWAYFGGLSMVREGQGQAAALALLAALPLYMTGATLGLVCREGSREAGETVAGGGPALLGAATGFVVYGLVLMPRLAPPVLVLVCMAAISGAALMHGSGRAQRDASSSGEAEDEMPGGEAASDDSPGGEATSGEPATRESPESSSTQTAGNSES